VTIEEIVRVLHQNAENATRVVKAAVTAMRTSGIAPAPLRRVTPC